MIKILADQHLYKIDQFIPDGTQVTLYDPQKGIPNLDGFDAFLVQTVTHLNEETLAEPAKSIKFIGTGSSGTDHIDIPYYEEKGIEVADAKGCNAPAVAEYVITALLIWHSKFQPEKNVGKVGVIGVGKAGSAVISLLKALNIDYVAYDPPRAERDPDFKSASLDEVLNCDILTLHVPLNKSGEYSTFHWLNEDKLHNRTFDLIINAARGGIIDEQALMKSYHERSVKHFVLDVWENEPDFNPDVSEHAFIATPHIAGYSEQSKINATRIICKKLADYFELDGYNPQNNKLSKVIDLEPINYNLKRVLVRLHPIMEYDKALRELTYHKNKKLLFRKLRNDLPYRYEYPYLKIRTDILNSFEELKKLGVKSS